MGFEGSLKALLPKGSRQSVGHALFNSPALRVTPEIMEMVDYTNGIFGCILPLRGCGDC